MDRRLCDFVRFGANRRRGHQRTLSGTPRPSLYGAPDTTRLLFPRNLTPDSTGLASWSEDDIVKAIRTGVRPNNTQILPPMPWPDYARLTDEDAHAIAAYLKTLPAVKHVMPAVVPPGQKFKGAMLVFPPPPAWDAKNLPPPGR
jgi:hypothetical protein